MIRERKPQVEKRQEHTPGPWEAMHSGFGDAKVVAKCGWKNKDGSPFEPEIVRRAQWGDARLIAAAPELLVALKSALVLCNSLGKNNDEIAFGGRNDFSVGDMARKAILKAEGGE